MSISNPSNAQIPNTSPAFQNPSFNSLLYVSFNQDRSSFACGFNGGVKVYNCDPFQELFSTEFSNGISIVQMFFQCKILAIVFTRVDDDGDSRKKVIIWDANNQNCVKELSCEDEIVSIRLRLGKIVVVLEQNIFVYNLLDLKLLHDFITVDNPKGLCEISYTDAPVVIVCPGLKKGEIMIEHLDKNLNRSIIAHESDIACLAITPDGQLVATASIKGTLIRIFNAFEGTRLQEVRRGTNEAKIYSLAFSPNLQCLALSCNKNTVHVFRLKPDCDEMSDIPCDSNLVTAATPTPSTSSFSIKGVLPRYFCSERSFAKFYMPENSEYIVAFGHLKNETVVILGNNGRFYRCKFDQATGGAMTQLEYHNFVRPD